MVAAVLLSAALLLVPSYVSRKTVTEPAATTTTEATTMTTVSTGCMSNNASGSTALLACCASVLGPAHGFGTLVVGTSSPAVICVQLYELSSSPTLLNLTSLLHILGPEPGAFESSPAGNFTVVPSQDVLLIGGPSNANEGTVVAYSITAKPGASGTYAVGLPGWLLGGRDGGVFGAACTDGQLIVGNGQPNYLSGGSCLVMVTSSSSSSTNAGSTQSFTIPGASDPYSNTLYFKVIYVTNATQ